MPVPTITESGPPLTPEHLEKLESKLGARLPGTYRRFLLRHNGGRPEPYRFGNNALHSFLGIHAKKKTYDIWSNRQTLKEWLPAEVLPIAVNVFGDFICLAIKGKNRGKVYSWDHEGGSEKVDPRIEFPWLELGDDYEFKGDDWPGHPDLTLIADSFDEFLDSFHDEDDPPAPENKAQKKRK